MGDCPSLVLLDWQRQVLFYYTWKKPKPVYNGNRKLLLKNIEMKTCLTTFFLFVDYYKLMKMTVHLQIFLSKP